MTDVSTTLSPWRLNTISTVVCVLSFKPMFTSVYGLLLVVSSVPITATVSGVGAGHNLYQSGNSNACSSTFKFLKCGLRKFSLLHILVHSFSSLHYEIIWHFYLYYVLLRKFYAFIVHQFQHYLCSEINCIF
jgi:hypothetical protein